jgi:hypothetical protein
MNRDESLPGPSHQKPFAPPPGEKLRHAGAARRLVVRRDQVIKQLRGSWPSFQRSVDHGHHVIEMHAWRSPWRLAQQAEIKSRGLCAFLLVEDDASMRESLNRLVTTLGHRANVAQKMSEALDLAILTLSDFQSFAK